MADIKEETLVKLIQEQKILSDFPDMYNESTVNKLEDIIRTELAKTKATKKVLKKRSKYKSGTKEKKNIKFKRITSNINTKYRYLKDLKRQVKYFNKFKTE